MGFYTQMCILHQASKNNPRKENYRSKVTVRSVSIDGSVHSPSAPSAMHRSQHSGGVESCDGKEEQKSRDGAWLWGVHVLLFLNEAPIAL
jgi:hypothetical protein